MTASSAGPTLRRIPPGDDRERLVCGTCGYVAYENPKVIVGAVCQWEDRTLLVRRAIAPRLGFWTMPVGYMEMGETTEAGAAREVWEEARARVAIDALLGVFSFPTLGQVHLIHRARMLSPDHAPGPESLEARLFAWDEIPWNDLAYPNVAWVLEHERAMRGRVDFAPLFQPLPKGPR